MSADKVVVGVDGGTGALRAVRWAARECAADDAELVLLHALGHAAGRPPVDTEQVLADAEAAARAAVPAVGIRHVRPAECRPTPWRQPVRAHD
jgi:nucleotide-binding universal stress UspA family protein